MIVLSPMLSFVSMANADVTVALSAQGLSQSSSAILEPDVSGAAGPGRYAEFVNGAFGVFDPTTGAITSQSTDHAFWQNAGISASALSNGASNPRLIYDPNSGRWFATEITDSSPANSILLAVSTGSNPSPTPGNWNATSFSAAAAGSAYAYGSFPTLGLDANGVYIATDNYNGSSEFAESNSSVSLFSIPKSGLLGSSPSLANMTAFYGTAGNYETEGYILQPVIDFSPQKGSAVVVSDNYDVLGAINRFNVVGTTNSSASLSPLQSVSLAPYAFPPSPRQPDGSGNFKSLQGLNIPDDRYASSAYQVGNLIYTVHTIGLPANAADPTCCALRWSVLKAVNDSTAVLVQQGMISNPNYDYFNPSICANAAGQVVIGYNRSGPSQTDGMIVSLISVGCTTGGTITFPNAIQVSSNAVTSFHNSAGASPWGDYSSLSPDPSNSSIFWFAEEVPEPSSANSTVSSTWGTQITEIEVPEPSVVSLIALASMVGLSRRLQHLAVRFREIRVSAPVALCD